MLATSVIPTPGKPGKPRGFAALKARGETDRLREIALLGAQCAGMRGKAHRWTPAEAKAARAKRNSRPLSADPAEGESTAA